MWKKNIGVKYILHSSFADGPRMVQNYHNVMAIFHAYGAPDLSTSFTCNPKWDEITNALMMEPGQSYSDRLDIATQIFFMEVDEGSKLLQHLYLSTYICMQLKTVRTTPYALTCVAQR